MEIIYDPDDCQPMLAPLSEVATSGAATGTETLRRGHDDTKGSPDRPGSRGLGDRRSVVTIGAYDGVHLGHRTIISEVIRRARSSDAQSVVVTFDRHPAQVIRPESAPLQLTTLDQKLELLETTGIDRVVVIRFDLERSQESAEDFVRTVLVGCLNVQEVVVGEDFHFGHQRRGNIAMLTEMGTELGFSVMAHRLVAPNGTAARDNAHVSSTAIRRAISEGRVLDANRMLGRRHEITGPVITGDQRGRTLGFPTANVAVPNDMLMPSDGIYAGWLGRYPDGLRNDLASAIYVGKRPTFYDNEAMTLLEVHVLDFAGNLYGENVSVVFDHMIRPDAKFASVDELVQQLRRDCDQVRSDLAKAPRTLSHGA